MFRTIARVEGSKHVGVVGSDEYGMREDGRRHFRAWKPSERALNGAEKKPKDSHQEETLSACSASTKVAIEKDAAQVESLGADIVNSKWHRVKAIQLVPWRAFEIALWNKMVRSPCHRSCGNRGGDPA